MRLHTCLATIAMLISACRPALPAQGNDVEQTRAASSADASATDESNREEILEEDKKLRAETVYTDSPAALAGASLGDKLRENMTYADFRDEVLAKGWKPAINPECMTDVVGGDFETICSAHLNSALCTACTQMPELQAYGAGGRALLRYSHPAGNLVLEATAFGEFKGAKETPEYEPDMLVTSWKFSEK